MQGNKKENQQNDNRLVTVAIHTYEKAQILKTILESEGIESVIHGINLIEPSIPGSVRVRIKEIDLQRALRVIEQVDFTSKTAEDEEETEETNKEILIPVDFSDYTLLTCEFGFKLAKDLKCSVKLMHAFFTPFYPAAMPFSDAFTLPATDKDLYHDVRKETESEMKALNAKIDEY
ncbi:MAG TPA: universal stress protein, partial [Bacteroidales bacterium]|nr:universal stress protein [Bacteroidales bacterium]